MLPSAQTAANMKNMAKKAKQKRKPITLKQINWDVISKEDAAGTVWSKMGHPRVNVRFSHMMLLHTSHTCSVAVPRARQERVPVPTC